MPCSLCGLAFRPREIGPPEPASLTRDSLANSVEVSCAEFSEDASGFREMKLVEVAVVRLSRGIGALREDTDVLRKGILQGFGLQGISAAA